MKCGLVLEFCDDRIINCYFIPEFDDVAVLSFLTFYTSEKAPGDYDKTYPVGCLTMLQLPLKDGGKLAKKAKEFAESRGYKVVGEDIYEIYLTFTNRMCVKFVVFEVEI